MPKSLQEAIATEQKYENEELKQWRKGLGGKKNIDRKERHESELIVSLND